MNEIRDIHEPFIAWLRKLEIPYHRNRPDKRTTAVEGDPDFLVSWMQHCLYIECKVPGKKLSPKQEERIAYVRRAGNKVVIAYSLEECIEATKNVLCVGKTDLSGGVEPKQGEQFRNPPEAVRKENRPSSSAAPLSQNNLASSLSEMQKADRLRRKTRMTLRLPEPSREQKNLSGGVESRHAAGGKIEPSHVSQDVAGESPARMDSGSCAPPAQNLFIANIAGVDWVCKGSGQPGSEAERIRRATPADIINIR